MAEPHFNPLDLHNLPKEPLHPELKARLCKGLFGKMISHPLIHEIIYDEKLNALYNLRFKTISEEVDKARKEKNWRKFVFFHEKPYRLDAFGFVEGLTGDRTYWELLGEVWVNSENVWQNFGRWKRYLKSKRPYKEYFMDAAERTAFDALPAEMEIYRGYDKSPNGLSYTLSKVRAQWFADRFSTKGFVKTRVVSKDEVFAYIGRRGEDEIILKP